MSPAGQSPDPARPVTDDAGHRDVLRLLLEAGAEIVQDLAASTETTPAAKAQPYERLARAIRRTIVLARHIVEHPSKPAAEPLSPVAAEIARRVEARRRIIRNIDTAIRHRTERPEQAETLIAEFHERLHDPDFHAQIANRPIDDIIRDLERDLGLETPTYFGTPSPRRTPAQLREIARLAAALPKIPRAESRQAQAADDDLDEDEGLNDSEQDDAELDDPELDDLDNDPIPIRRNH